MSKFFSDLRAFLQENSDVVWSALCLFFCGLTILFAALRHEESEIVDIEGNTGAINIIKNNRIRIVGILKGN